MQSRGDQQVGIGPGAYLIIGGVTEQIVVVGFVLRVAPLIPFEGGEGNTGVQHGGDHVNKGHGGDDAMKDLGCHVDGGAHEQATGTATVTVYAIGIGPGRGFQICRGINVVGEGILLVEQFAVLIPLAPQFLSSPDMGNGPDEAAIEQTQPTAAEGRPTAGAIGAVGV